MTVRRTLMRCGIAAAVLSAAPARAGDIINEYLTLLPDAGGPAGFGRSVAIDNGIVAVGAPFDDDNGFSSGSAYLFDATTGEQLFKLVPDDGAAGDRFGSAIAIDGGIVAVGASDQILCQANDGQAYLFDAATGLQINTLSPGFDACRPIGLGGSIDIDGGVVVVGMWVQNPGSSAYVFEHVADASVGDEMRQLFPGETIAAYMSVAIERGTIVVGAPAQNDDQGLAYVFDWTLFMGEVRLFNVPAPHVREI